MLLKIEKWRGEKGTSPDIAEHEGIFLVVSWKIFRDTTSRSAEKYSIAFQVSYFMHERGEERRRQGRRMWLSANA
jgi:hypothetical protein